jgi:hypothetical protein
MPRAKDYDSHQRTRGRGSRYKPVENRSDPSTYPVIPLCSVASCGKPLVRRDGFIVCPADPSHFTQKVIIKELK